MEGNLDANSVRSRRAMDLADSGRVTLQTPSELAGPLPRAVTLNLDGDTRYLLWIVLLFFVGGGVLLAWLCSDDFQQFQNRAVLRRNGRVVVGTVTKPSRCCTNYRFGVGGSPYQGKAREPLFQSKFSHPSDQILIRFLPSNPAINHPDSWEWTVYVGLEYIVLLAFFWTMGGLALVFLCRDRTLARKGNVASGVVTGCVLKDGLFHTEYEFRTADGTPMKGHIDRKEEYETGTRVWVLYLSQRPRRKDLYPLLLFDVAG
jgi:Protein of unknown function (DUF3592)